MEKNEVRQGNWIQIECNGKVFTARIDELYTTGSLVLTGKECYSGYELSECKPIALTETWLRRFGFDKDEEWYSRGHLHYNIESNYFYSGNDHVSGGNPDATIKYVHQLQNLYFALTGEELAVKTA